MPFFTASLRRNRHRSLPWTWKYRPGVGSAPNNARATTSAAARRPERESVSLLTSRHVVGSNSRQSARRAGHRRKVTGGGTRVCGTSRPDHHLDDLARMRVGCPPCRYCIRTEMRFGELSESSGMRCALMKIRPGHQGT